MGQEPKSNWGLDPNFQPHIVQPPKSFWKKVASFFTPQVNAVIVAWVLTGVPTAIGWINGRAKVQELQTENFRLKVDINRLTTEKTALESQYAVYSSIPLQVPKVLTGLETLLVTDPTNRQAIVAMLGAVQSITNLLADIAAIPSFAVYVNNQLLTNNAVITLDKSRRLNLRLRNQSNITAENLSIDLLTPLALSATNLVCDGWQEQPGGLSLFSDDNITDLNVAHHWYWMANKPVAPLQGHYVASLQFLTNVAFPVIQVQFSVYANRSKRQTYLANIVLNQPSQ